MPGLIDKLWREADFRRRTWLQSRMRRQFMRLQYRGPCEELLYKTCIGYYKDGQLVCQFDDVSLEVDGIMMGFNWHRLPNHHLVPFLE